ncbi:hypothetical protein SCA6_016132 [Theobroma cacao]
MDLGCKRYQGVLLETFTEWTGFGCNCSSYYRIEFQGKPFYVKNAKSRGPYLVFGYLLNSLYHFSRILFYAVVRIRGGGGGGGMHEVMTLSCSTNVLYGVE